MNTTTPIGAKAPVLPTLRAALGDLGAREGQRCEAPPIVGKILSGGIHIGTARPVEIGRRVEHEDIEALMRGGENAGGFADEVVERGDHLDLADGRVMRGCQCEVWFVLRLVLPY